MFRFMFNGLQSTTLSILIWLKVLNLFIYKNIKNNLVDLNIVKLEYTVLIPSKFHFN